MTPEEHARVRGAKVVGYRFEKRGPIHMPAPVDGKLWCGRPLEGERVELGPGDRMCEGCRRAINAAVASQRERLGGSDAS